MKLVRSFYNSSSFAPEPPLELSRRELAFAFFEKEEMLRHVSFNSAADLKAFIASHAPRHVYYSSAYYFSPSEGDMDSKRWMGADLIFDIDADHIPTSCKGEHDKWRCLDCGASGRGTSPPVCPSCSGRRMDSRSLYLCPTCLEAAKLELLKLIEDFLIPDFGLSPGEMHVVFSGRRGYHVHITSAVVRELDQYARREIVDYLKAVSLKPESHGFHALIKASPSPPSLSHPGWRGRIARGIYSFLSSSSLADLKALLPPSKKGLAAEIYYNKDKILSQLESPRPNWSLILKYGRKFWERLVLKAIELQRCEVDERVTTDVRRLIRLPGTIHGDTGLIAKALTLNEVDSFDPLRDSIVFKRGEVRVRVYECPQLSLMGRSFGPFNNEVVTLPVAVAFYLLRCGMAELAEDREA
ncbi:MAG: DNA primase small subunit PriS [Candidatus Nezhaarchaeota archaeon]|nr:DNA primase small subunit PriS [Candidatus Nezhaarchaeota archaeon]